MANEGPGRDPQSANVAGHTQEVKASTVGGSTARAHRIGERDRLRAGRGTTRAEDAQGTPA